MPLLEKFKKIKCFVFDIDGVLTDGTLTILENGELLRNVNVKDGYALQLATQKGYEIAFISGGHSEALKKRLISLGVANIFMRIDNKLEVLQNFAVENNITADTILYMGDDMPDIAPMQWVGLSTCPTDATYEVLQIATYISPHIGGKECVRDVIYKVLKMNNHWQ